MNKFAVDYNILETELKPKPKIFKYEDVKHRLRKVAFDVVRFDDGDDLSGLWQIKKTDNGEYIIAMYEEDATSLQEKVAWKAVSDGGGDNIYVFYKNSPVGKMSLASLGLTSNEAKNLAKHLPQVLSGNKKLVSGFLNTLTAETRLDLLSNYPELQD